MFLGEFQRNFAARSIRCRRGEENERKMVHMYRCAANVVFNENVTHDRFGVSVEKKTNEKKCAMCERKIAEC